MDKLSEYIELLNQGLIPKNNDQINKFSNGTKINQYWAKNREKIISELENNPRYNTGYEVAKKIVKNYIADLIENRLKEYIELLNNGLITPKDNDTIHTFSNGRKINNFWTNNKEKIIALLNNAPEYRSGYEKAKETINKYLSSLNKDYLSEYIDLLNNGLIPTSKDKNHSFSDGRKINNYWVNNKNIIIKTLFENPKYQYGYEKAKEVVKTYLSSLTFDKIADYIELLNNGIISPITYDSSHTFSNGEKINYYWSNNSQAIINRLNIDPKYNSGYEKAKETIKKYLASLKIDKVHEYIELLNNGIVEIQFYDPNHTFSNGEKINYYFKTNRLEVIKRLSEDQRYNSGYEIAKRKLEAFIHSMTIDKVAEYIELLNNGIITPKTYEKNIKFSDGTLINRFWSHKKDEIIKRLNEDPKYNRNYEVAKNIIKTYLESLSFDKIAEYIELLNNGLIAIKDCDDENSFSNGELIKYFWPNNKENIVKRISTDLKYKTNYERAINIIMQRYKKLDKISEYIELLNKGYIPKISENNLSFSDNTIIGDFWSKKEYQFQIAYELNHNPKYNSGYEIAKKTIQELTNLINSLGGNEKRAESIYIANRNLRKKRQSNKRYNPTISDLLKYFSIDINTLDMFLSRVSNKSGNKSPIIEYENMSLSSYCLKRGYNYRVIYRLLKLNEHLPNKTFHELIELTIDTYQKKGQAQPTKWVYEKYGLLLKHLLLLLNLDIKSILYNLKKYCISLEEAIRHEVFKSNIPSKDYKWLEEPFNYIIGELDPNKDESTTTTDIANKIYSLNGEYSFTKEEINILLDLLKKYIYTIRQYLTYNTIFESNRDIKIRKIITYNLTIEEIEDALFESLRIEGNIVQNKDTPYSKHLTILKKYYLVWNMLTEEQQNYLKSKENITIEDIILMQRISTEIKTINDEINNRKNINK